MKSHMRAKSHFQSTCWEDSSMDFGGEIAKNDYHSDLEGEVS